MKQSIKHILWAGAYLTMANVVTHDNHGWQILMGYCTSFCLSTCAVLRVVDAIQARQEEISL